MTVRSGIRSLLYGRYSQRLVAVGATMLVTGLVLGLIDYSAGDRFLWGIPAGGAFGVVVGLLAEWRTRRRGTRSQPG